MSASERLAWLRWRQWASSRSPEPPPSTPPAAVATKATFLRRLELDVTRRLDGLLSGNHPAYASGPGTEAAGARPYGPGDDARHIDWNLTARILTPHVRITEADRELETCIVVDRSASLDFGTAQREKREVAMAAVASFGYLDLRAGNRLSCLIAGGDQLIPQPARGGRLALLGVLSVLYDTPRRETTPGVGADLTAALLRVERTQRRRGRIVVVSDFLDTCDWAAPIRRLALRHQVVAVQVTDPREWQLPAVGMLSVVDTESGQHLHVQTNSATLRARYEAAASERQARIAAVLARAGVEHLQLSTDRDWLLAVAQFVRRRRGPSMGDRWSGGWLVPPLAATSATLPS